MLLNKTYRDSMDVSRTLKPVSSDKGTARCRVYFDGVFNGFANVPVKLFVNDPTPDEDSRYMPQSERIGYVLDNA